MTPLHQIPEPRIAINPVVIDDSKRGNPPGWEAVEPEEDGVCFKCDPCIASNPPDVDECAIVCHNCKCDRCKSAGGLDPLKKWKAHPRPSQKHGEKKHTGTEFLNEVVR